MIFLPWLQSRAAKHHEQRDALEVRGNGFNLGAIWSFLDGGGGRNNESDEVVNDSTALAITTVYTCCRVLADGIASLSCRVYKQTPNGKQKDIDAPLSHLLQFEPNDETSVCSFFETLVTHLNLRGNGYAEIQHNAAGDSVALWNLHPRKTEPARLGINGTLAYKCSEGMGPNQTASLPKKTCSTLSSSVGTGLSARAQSRY